MEVQARDNRINILVVDDDQLMLNLCKMVIEMSFRNSCRIYTATNSKEVETILKKKCINLFIVDVILGNERGDQLAKGYKSRFPDSVVCLLTGCIDEVYQDLDGGIFPCFMKSENDKEGRPSIMQVMHYYFREKERRSSNRTENIPCAGLIKVVGREAQKGLEAFHFCLKRDPDAHFMGVALRHDDHRGKLNLCLTLGGCKAGCRMCGTARFMKRDLQLTALEYADQVAYLLESYKSFKAFEGQIVIQNHGGGEIRFCMNEYCGGVEEIERRYQLNAHYIATSIGGAGVWEELIARLGSQFDMSFEISANATNEKRDWLMPATKGDSLQKQIDILANDGARTGRHNKYRHLLIGNFNDSEEEADAIADLLRGTPLSVIVTKMEYRFLPKYPKLLTEEFANNFVRLLTERGINAYFKESVGEGLVICGGHVSFRNRGFFGKMLLK